MIIFQSKSALSEYLASLHQNGQTISFVPTMGALHKGHLSLIGKAKEKADIVVCSVYVNPTQFNDKSDLDKYPRTIKADSAMLKEEGCDVLFLPRHQEIYPDGYENYKPIELNDTFLISTLEGAKRPGHFEGMATVVYLLLEIVKPNFLMMGLKDYQQALIVEAMLEQKQIATHLHKCAIVREADGLAMSSRNRRLSVLERGQAPEIHKSLLKLKSIDDFGQLEMQLAAEIERLNSFSELNVEYLEIRKASDLAFDYEQSDKLIALAAIWCGDVRLIDNELF